MNALVTIQPRLPMPAECDLLPTHWRVLTDATFPSAKTADAIMLAIDYCKTRRLDVFKRPVHIVPMWNSALRREVETVWPGISELQVTASRTGAWAGMDAPEWGPMRVTSFTGQDNGATYTIKLEHPEWCSVTVWRLIDGVRYAFCEPVYWLEAYARRGKADMPADMWKKRPRGQLHKNAKAASLRAAFPEEMGNDYTAEEMEGQVIEGVATHVDRAAPAQRQAIARAPDAVDYDAIPSLDAPAPDRALQWLEAQLAKLAAMTFLDELHTMKRDAKVYARLDELETKRPELAAQYNEAMRLAMETLTEVEGGE